MPYELDDREAELLRDYYKALAGAPRRFWIVWATWLVGWVGVRVLLADTAGWWLVPVGLAVLMYALARFGLRPVVRAGAAWADYKPEGGVVIPISTITLPHGHAYKVGDLVASEGETYKILHVDGDTIRVRQV